ncbi:MAG TPA: peptide chain release factor N(5)-glutamine methyltransferase, partial [Oligoflexia bacterium]|nr:peptide chain release factor N(5)-glutamine methyltransferase [Oligoflexia bacterium]
VSDVLSAVRVKPERHGAVLIVSNPPYISDSEELSFQISGFEPKCALRAGEKGLDVIERLIREAAPILRQKGPLGALVMEIGAGQDSDVRCIAQREELTTINYIQDLRGVKRVVEVGK